AVDTGSVDLDGLDLQGSEVAIALKQAGATATFKHGVAVGGAAFTIARGATLTADHVTFQKTTSPSLVAGTLAFSYVDFSTTISDGIVGSDPSAVIRIEDSYLHGDGMSDADMLVGNGLSSLHV